MSVRRRSVVITPADPRLPRTCPRCGELCVYDGWDHVHRSGLGIGSCDSPEEIAYEELLSRRYADDEDV
jgi:hypothetical protein